MQYIEKYWLRLWLIGIILLSMMIFLNRHIVNDITIGGIMDHQLATNAARVNEIQDSWMINGQLDMARLSMAIDLFFIAIYSMGAFGAGRVLSKKSSALYVKLGWLIMFSAAIFCLTDYAETICQNIQIWQMGGDDKMAKLAANMQIPKNIAFLISLIGIIIILFVQNFFMKKKI
ncbi:hypothetical protein LPB140_08205 [Sphingorhabdus lutea]|uniref:Uncharacterized protein n=1 Tax=Sphingorhabdus lutea TaxID=1913578 RepID=A0A1L3JCC4_9SPHN|nr:hypothetical protein [Sphingorhabdus lutea]APG62772.1 hypothetical protein LPB140_08205 [Sphingorhabdus lutea]